VKARQLIGGAAFMPDALKVIFEAFDDAWDEVAPGVSVSASAIEAARLSLATIVLSIVRLAQSKGLASRARPSMRSASSIGSREGVGPVSGTALRV
jgi:hypothetical protein